MTRDDTLRAHVLYLLRGGNAHLSFDAAIAGFPVAAMNDRLPKLPYSPWALLEHLRIAQWDIL
ncbi:MAG: hypothetical protein ACE5EL_07375 [Anaerolineae bacterium]